jgi:hypothetical protein
VTHSANDFGTEKPSREEADDLDLLTYGEARVRLAEELDAEESHHAELLSRNSDPGPGEELAASQRRIDALRSTLERTNTRAISKANEAEFYGHGIVDNAHENGSPHTP